MSFGHRRQRDSTPVSGGADVPAVVNLATPDNELSLEASSGPTAVGPFCPGPCGDLAVLTDGQAAMLACLSGLVGHVQQAVACELAARHEGGHVAFTVASDNGDRSWWVMWSHQPCRVIALDVCTYETEGQERDTCLLPARHPGPHSFDLAA